MVFKNFTFREWEYESAENCENLILGYFLAQGKGCPIVIHLNC